MRTLAPQRRVRALSAPEARVSVDAGTRWAWMLEDELAAIYEAQILAIYDNAARLLARIDRRSRSIRAASPPSDWSVPDPDELGLSLREQMDARHAQRQQGDAATDAIRAEAIRRTTAAGLQIMGVSLSARNALVEGVLRDQLGGKITGIRETTRRDVMASIESSWRDGDSIPRTAKALRAAAPGIAASRSRTIARTEMLAAVNGGAHALAALSDRYGAEEGQAPLLKIWLTAQDERVRDSHVDAGSDYGSGSGIPMSEPFVVGGANLMYPGDPDGPADEVINCRCTISYEESDAPAPESTPDVVAQEVDSPTAPSTMEGLANLVESQALERRPIGDVAPRWLTNLHEAATEAAYDRELLHPGGVGSAVDEYQSTAYRPVNAVLRGEMNARELDAEDASVLSRMKDAFARHETTRLTEDATLFRASSVERGADVAGTTITDPAFASATINASEVERFARDAAREGREKVVLRLRAPAGTEFLVPTAATEGEVILAPGTTYRIVGESAERIGGVRTLDAEITPPARPLVPEETPAETMRRMNEEGASLDLLDQVVRDVDAAREEAARGGTFRAEEGNEIRIDHATAEWGNEALVRMFGSEALADNGYVTRVQASQDRFHGVTEIHVHAFVNDPATGEEVAEIERHINLADGSVKHDFFFIAPEYQGMGIAKDILRSSVDEYDRTGITKVHVGTAQVGRYTWSRFGFDYNTANGLASGRAALRKAIFERAEAARILPRDLDVTNEAAIERALGEAFPETMAKISTVEHSWEVGGFSINEGGLDVPDLGKQAMLHGPSWTGTLDLTPGSETRRVFDAYTR